MPRVLVIEAAGNLWGSERALLDLLDGLETAQIAVCLPKSAPLEPALRRRAIPVYPFLHSGLHHHSKWRRVQAALGILRACLAFRPHVVYLNQSGVYRIALPAALICRLGLVAHVRIFEDAAHLAGCSPSPTRLRGVIAISRAIERELRSFRALDSIQIHTLYDAYIPANAPQKAERSRPNRIVCVGRVVPIKGQDILANAMAAVRETFPDADCLIIGDGDPEFVKTAKDASASLDGAVKWMGFHADVMPLLRRSAVLVCPSWREPLGRVILEAWDAGAIPIVFSGSGGAAEMVSAAAGGLLYNEQDPSTLAKTIVDALSLGTVERAAMIEKGRAWSAAYCGPSAYAAAMLDIFTRSAR